MGRITHVRTSRPGVPIIAIWSASIGSLPGGWTLCEELVDHWPMGVRELDGSDLATTGGALSVELSHYHTWETDPLPRHRSDEEDSHGHVSGFGLSAGALGPGLGFSGDVTYGQSNIHTHGADGVTTTTYPHDHALQGDTDTDGFTQDLRPPYDARAYMRGTAEIPIGAIALFDRPASALLPFTAGPTTTLTVDVDGSTVFELWSGMDPSFPIPTPFTCYVDAESVQVLAVSGFGWFVERGQSFTAKSAHTAGALIRLPRYAICDGSSGTPGLRGGFVIGADGETFELGDYYGSDDVFAPIAHSHATEAISVGITAHLHTLQEAQLRPALGLGVVTVGLGFPEAASVAHQHTIGPLAGNSGGAHAHTLHTTSGTDDGHWTPGSFSPLPPYYRLYFIQRVDYGDATSDTCPIGTILHTPGAAPTNWAICDGTGGTPELQARTVVGAGGSYGVGDAGGDGGFNIPPHEHGVGTSQLSIGSGDHDWTIGTSEGGGAVGTLGGPVAATADAPNTHQHPAIDVLASDPATGIVTESGHDHGFSGLYEDNEATTNATNRLPTTLALNYIQRVA